MSNYITIESGYYEPFKENETDPELKIWADKYFEIIKKIHEVLLPYNERYEHFVELEERIDKLESEINHIRQTKLYKQGCREELILQFSDEMNSLFEDNEIGFLNSPNYQNERESQDFLWRYNHLYVFFRYAKDCIKQHFSDETIKSQIEKDFFELKEKLRKCLLHRVWKGRNSILINESNIVSVDLFENRESILLFRSSVWKIEVFSFKTPHLYLRAGDVKYIMNREEDLYGKDSDSDTVKMTYSIIDDIKAIGTSPLSEGFLLNIKYGLIPMFADIASKCSIVETYKDFQFGNIEKIKNDKIKCGCFNTRNAMDGIRVYD